MAVFSSLVFGFAYLGGFLAGAMGLSFGAAIAFGQAVGYIGAGLVANALLRKLKPKVSVPSTEVKANIKQADAYRRIYFGRYLAGGVNAFFEVKGATLYQVILVSHGHVDGFEEFRIDSKTVEVGTDPFGVTNTVLDQPYYNMALAGVGILIRRSVRVFTRDGSGAGGDYDMMIDQFDNWTEEHHRLENQATFMVAAVAPEPEDFQKVFPKADFTLYQHVIRGQRIWRQSTETEEWTDNAARVIGHYLQHPDGFRIPRDEINWTSVDAMSAWAALPVQQHAGGTASNMRLWGYWTLDEAPRDVLDRLTASSHIVPYEMQDGRIGLMGGPFGEPACTLTAKDIREIQTSAAISEREGYNMLRVQYLSPDHKYEIVEAEPWKDTARLTTEGEIAQEYSMEHCPNLSQARRLAKAQMHNDNRAKIEIKTNMVGLKARWPKNNAQRHTILLDYRPEDGSGREIVGEYEVLDHVIDPINMECSISLARVDRTSMEWDPEEEGEPPSPLPDESSNPPPPLDASMSVTVTEVTGNQKQATIEVTAVGIEDRADLVLEARYREVGAEAWRQMISYSLTATSDVVTDGSTYEVEVRWTGVFDGVDEWHPLGTITVAVDQTPPGTPRDVEASEVSSQEAIIFWTNPDSDFYRIEVYRHVSGTGLGDLIGTTGGASGQSSNFTDPNPPLDIAITYRVRAINSSGVPGDAASAPPITIDSGS